MDCNAFNAMLVLFGAREAGCIREVVASYSNHLRFNGTVYIVKVGIGYAGLAVMQSSLLSTV